MFVICLVGKAEQTLGGSDRRVMFNPTNERRRMRRKGFRLMAQEAKKPDAPEQWLTIEQAANYTGYSRSTLYHNINDIPHEKRGKALRFTRQGLSDWITRRA